MTKLNRTRSFDLSFWSYDNE